MSKFFRWILLLPNLWLIYHIFTIGYDARGVTPLQGSAFTFLAQLGALTEFKQYRNMLYIAYGALILLVALHAKIVSGRLEKQKDPHISSSADSLMIQVNDIVIALLITTFAYAIAALLLDIVFIMR